MRLRELIRRSASDPLLKVGVISMLLALGFASVVAVAAFLDGPERTIAAKSAAESTAGPLVRSDPDINPRIERDIPPPTSGPESSPNPRSLPEQRPQGAAEEQAAQQAGRRPQPEQANSQPIAQAQAEQRPAGRPDPLVLDESDYPLPTDNQLEAAKQPRHYHLPPGAIMSLTIDAIDLHNVPVLDSDSPQALDRGVVHIPQTSLPWSPTPERNVYLAGHRIGWPGTGSRLVFYRLDELRAGQMIEVRDREGTRYDYRVVTSFIVDPGSSWVMGRVKGRDLLSLQTCTPIPTFEKRLIVRAERV